MTEAEKAAGFEYLQEKRHRSKAAFSDVLDKYMDLQRLYNELYLLR